MTTLLRSATVRLSPSPIDLYVPLDHGDELKKSKTRRYNNSRRLSSSSKRRKKQPSETPISLPPYFSYRRERARQRHLFLKTYKLSSADSLKKSRPRRLVKKTLRKLRWAVLRIVSTARMRIGSLRTCSCISGAIDASPRRGSCL